MTTTDTTDVSRESKGQKRSLRVAMIMQRYYPLVGGAEKLVGALAPQLQAHGIEVAILTRRYPGLSPFEQIEGVPVYRLPIPGPKAIASFSFTLSALPRLLNLRADVLHAHEVFSPATTAVAARRFTGAPIVITAHRSGPLGDVQRLQHKLMGQRRLTAFAQQAAAFTAISREIGDELAAAGVPAQKIHYIPNGVDTQRFAPLDYEAKQKLRARLNLPQQVEIAVFVGRLAAEKRPEQLLAAWREIHAARPGAALLMLGTGELEARLKASAGERVRFTGAVNNVVEYLQAADLFVLPSAAEGLSIAMLEAMSSGLPVLVTRVGGAPEVIVQGENGWLIEADAPDELRAGLLTLLNDAALRERLGQQARAEVIAKYSLEKMINDLIVLYRQLANWD